MAWHDVTRPLKEGAVVYPGDIVPRIVTEDRGKYLLSDLHLSTHSGTHIDAPSHYLRSEDTVDRIPPEKLMGPCRVIEADGGAEGIGPRELEEKIGTYEKILLKTAFSEKSKFEENYPGLSPEGARFLVDEGVRCVGIDSPSIEPFTGDGSVHLTILSEGVVIIELLDLSAIAPGEYWMAALPLRLEGLDGSPCRVFLGDKNPW